MGNLDSSLLGSTEPLGSLSERTLCGSLSETSIARSANLLFKSTFRCSTPLGSRNAHHIGQVPRHPLECLRNRSTMLLKERNEDAIQQERNARVPISLHIGRDVPEDPGE